MPSKPAVFELLTGQHNLALDDALVDALGEMEEELRGEALDILFRRGRPGPLEALVFRFAHWPISLQALIVENVGRLDTAIRRVITDDSLEARTGAIELIRRSNSGQLVYLLADALKVDCDRTRQAAARALYEMASDIINPKMWDRLSNRSTDRPGGLSHKSESPSHKSGSLSHRTESLSHKSESTPHGPGSPSQSGLEIHAAFIADALCDAVNLWERHKRFEVLNAALWFADRVEPTIRRKVARLHTNFAQAVCQVIMTTTDPRLAPFMLNALAIDSLATVAARAIERSRRDEFVHALLDSVWLLADRGIARGFSRIRELAWLREGPGPILALDSGLAVKAVRFISATAIPRETKLEWYQFLLASSNNPVRGAVVWQLVSDVSDGAFDLLMRVAKSHDDTLAVIARREVERRRPELRRDRGTGSTRPGASVPGATEWDDYWNRYDNLSPSEREEGVASIRRAGMDIPVLIRSKLASSQPLDRARALRIVQDLGLEKDLAEQVFHLAHDADPVVRSTVVAMLAALPGATSQRILRAAIDDPDYRVQANAVEALDETAAEHCDRMVAPKLESPNPRVRANAIKALLRLDVRDAGEALIQMLSDPSPGARLSALWVVERLELRSVIRRLEQIYDADPDAKVRRRAGRVVRSLESPVTRSAATR